MTNQIYLLLLALPVLSFVIFLRVRRKDQRRQFVQQRLQSLTVDKGDGETVHRLSRPRFTSPFDGFQLAQTIFARLNAEFEATGKRIGLLHLIAAGLLSAIIVFGFCSFVLGLSFLLTVVLTISAAIIAPYVGLQMAQSRYRRRFLDVFPDALDLVGRGVRAGLPVNEALATAGREIADPVGGELRRSLDQVQIGVPMIEALQQVADRVRAADFRFLVVSLALQSKTGGSLAETLGNLSGVIRARKALRLKARALTAEAKASAAVLAGLPFLVGGAMYLMNREMAEMLWVDHRGRFMLGIAFLSLTSGLATMYWLVKRALR